MKRIERILLLALVAVVVLALAAPAAATESHSEDEATTTTVAPELIFEGDQPAVVLPPISGEVEEQPWTSRYMYPAFGLLALLIIGGYAIAYQRSVRRKYVVVD